ncbi:hypothetical protein PR048_022240 [Dryococelus australis]|uniref:Uncharacterized protein n=1 Tax=Dryococelus australis TaxID=614101 RepID=A0ABQ9H0F0_9NEOP|nr:hypothetical protein PR048_022240 [Dryococelus australis]
MVIALASLSKTQGTGNLLDWASETILAAMGLRAVSIEFEGFHSLKSQGCEDIPAKQRMARVISRGIMTGSFTGEETCNRNVAKHTVDNYFLWARIVKQELLLKDVCEAVIGYEDTPGFVSPQTETRRRARNNAIALAIIFKYANKAWKKLDELCNDGLLVNGAMNLKQLTFRMIIGKLKEEFAMCVPSLEAEMTKLSLSKVKMRLLTAERKFS